MINRKSVNRVVTRKSVAMSPKRRTGGPMVDAIEDSIEKILEQEKVDSRPIKAIFQNLRDQGFNGGYKERLTKSREFKELLKRNCFLADVLRQITSDQNCWFHGERHAFSDKFRNFLLVKKAEHGLKWSAIGQMLGIPVKTLKTFRRQNSGWLDIENLSGSVVELSLREKTIEVLSPFLRDRRGRVTVKELCDKSPEILQKLGLSYPKLRKRLLKLKFVNVVGVLLTNTELDREERDLKRRRILEILHDRPASFSINRASWSLHSLRLAYHGRFDFLLPRDTIRVVLRQSGYTIKKARRTLTSPDPGYREKVELLLETLRNLGTDELLFFIDEMGPMRIKKYGGRLFVHKNDKPSIPQVQADKGSIIMSAALSATKNQVTWLYSRAKDTSAMIDLIEILFNQHPTIKQIYLTWDAAAWHRSAGLVQWLDDFNSETQRLGSGPSIHLIPLPTSSQFLDILEAVFSGMKKAVIHHSDYHGKAEMKSAIPQHFTERNIHFQNNPKRAGKKIWEIDFFDDIENLKSGNYREW